MEDPPDKVVCAYCGKETQSYQLVSQIPTWKCSQQFILTSLLNFSGDPMVGSDYVCFDHEETFRIKFGIFQNGLPFHVSHIPRSTKKTDENKICGFCFSAQLIYRRVSTIQSNALKNFILSEMKLKGKQAKRKGTGLSESDIICSACYQNVRKKFLTTNYSPCKPVKPRLSSDGKQSDGGDVASSSKSATSDTSSIVYIQ